MEGINTTKRNTSNIDQPVTYERIIDNFIDFCLLYLVLKFSCENSKPCHKLQIMTDEVKPVNHIVSSGLPKE